MIRLNVVERVPGTRFERFGKNRPFLEHGAAACFLAVFIGFMIRKAKRGDW